ncbi:hypothetical protein [Serratia fonticola]|uniref:hypothetical protein n=1 Tax=Serratia fonticola TaxID=47917 RepID=UPI0009399C9A|nr:hypothetical protein [Serratia fonticola]OKP28414.1 hypothetical protein BSQ40_12145 [Serratia fonticola]
MKQPEQKPIDQLLKQMGDLADEIIELSEDGCYRDRLIDLYDRADTVFGAANIKRLLGILKQSALADVITERQRQVSAEGWTLGHDDTHENGELALAAAEYAIQAAVAPWDDDVEYADHEPGNFWPWDATWWKPTNQRRDLVKAGALILAEIERIDRTAILKPDENDLAGVIE